jgi:hypothetical protein
MSDKKLSIKQRTRLAVLDMSAAPAVSQANLHPQVERKLSSGPSHTIAAMMQDDVLKDENRRLQNQLESQTSEIKHLSNEVSSWAGAAPAKKLNPALVIPSKWANRHSDSFNSPEFAELKADIQSAGGNVQAIKVRPISGTEPQTYEVVFGHRRHRACLTSNRCSLKWIERIGSVQTFAPSSRVICIDAHLMKACSHHCEKCVRRLVLILAMRPLRSRSQGFQSKY